MAQDRAKSTEQPERAAAGADPAPNTRPDAELAAAVERRLRRNLSVPADGLDVAATAGVVTLTGTVDNLAAKDIAEAVARATRGVRGVFNQVQVVVPTGLSDDVVQASVVAALAADPAADAYEVGVTVKQGIVTLSGTVQSLVEQELAELLARRVRGVTEVINQLQVRVPPRRADDEVRADILTRLKWDTQVDAGDVIVRVSDGVVTPSGTVRSAFELGIARTDAWVAGVRNVDITSLSVDPDRAVGANDPGERTDEAVRRAVKDAFLYDPRLRAANPLVSVSDGVVTLFGPVNNLAAKRAAESVARSTAGVEGVRNYLKVRPLDRRPDDAVARDVTAALGREALLDGYRFGVTVIGGRVYLTGAVATEAERQEAGAVAGRVKGVVSVHNFLVDGRPPLAWHTNPAAHDREVRADILDELRWSPFVDAAQVSVAVNVGVATLTGTVDDRSESQAADRAALAGGATRVVNELSIRPRPADRAK